MFGLILVFQSHQIKKEKKKEEDLEKKMTAVKLEDEKIKKKESARQSYRQKLISKRKSSIMHVEDENEENAADADTNEGGKLYSRPSSHRFAFCERF